MAHYSRTHAAVAQSSAEAELYALTHAAHDIIHLQFVTVEMGTVKSAEGIKLHLHTDTAPRKAMVSKLGMSKKSNTLSSDIFTRKTSSQSSCHIVATINTQQTLQQGGTGRVSAISSSSTAEMDTRAPKSRKKCEATETLNKCEFSDCQHTPCPLHRDCHTQIGLKEIQAAITGDVIVACQEQSSAITVRGMAGMALKCYSLNVRVQDAVTKCVAFTHIGVQ
eukprot:4138854-Amphidinium_carterae.1